MKETYFKIRTFMKYKIAEMTNPAYSFAQLTQLRPLFFD